ncbi:unnamed protein product [Mytilus edulis]|uniref:Uncharacterized protein n=1 Tax=Mytilus edulis TaxID=6550 RepID=A0A8S3RQU6_MYTED|nr:unnamed protein product [Mytilus edulis]
MELVMTDLVALGNIQVSVGSDHQMAQSACMGLAEAGAYASAIPRSCYGGKTCESICADATSTMNRGSSAGGPLSTARCVDAFHIYSKRGLENVSYQPYVVSWKYGVRGSCLDPVKQLSVTTTVDTLKASWTMPILPKPFNLSTNVTCLVETFSNTSREKKMDLQMSRGLVIGYQVVYPNNVTVNYTSDYLTLEIEYKNMMNDHTVYIFARNINGTSLEPTSLQVNTTNKKKIKVFHQKHVLPEKTPVIAAVSVVLLMILITIAWCLRTRYREYNPDIDLPSIQRGH